MFLYAGADRTWSHKVYAGKRGVGIARKKVCCGLAGVFKERWQLRRRLL